MTNGQSSNGGGLAAGGELSENQSILASSRRKKLTLDDSLLSSLKEGPRICEIVSVANTSTSLFQVCSSCWKQYRTCAPREKLRKLGITTKRHVRKKVIQEILRAEAV
jgi:predicted transcriptional regulator